MIKWRLNRLGEILLFMLKCRMRLTWQYISFEQRVCTCWFTYTWDQFASVLLSTLPVSQRRWEGIEVVFIKQIIRSVDQAKKWTVLALTVKQDVRQNQQHQISKECRAWVRPDSHFPCTAKNLFLRRISIRCS